MKVKEYYTEDHTLDLSNERPDPEYELFGNPEQLKQYRKDTEKMHWLDQEWQKVYKQIKQTGE